MAVDPNTLYIVCPDVLPNTFCRAFQDAVQTVLHGAVQIDLMAQTPLAGPWLAFFPLKITDHLLEGRLEWCTAGGATGAGPKLQLTAVDALIRPEMLADYAHQLVLLSNLPPLKTTPE